MGGGKTSERTVMKAKMANPGGFLASRGHTLEWCGRHGEIRLGDAKRYRITRMEDGRYLSLPQYGTGKIGDNIALAMDVDKSLDFRGAVAALLDRALERPGVPWGRKGETGEREFSPPPAYPPDIRLMAEGQRYLINARGISPEAVREAERQRAIGYYEGRVGFRGYDEKGELRSVAYQAISPSAPPEKRRWSEKGSQSRHPMILRGDPETLWLVEGGVDALAIWTLSAGANKPAPTVIMAGGTGVRSHLESEAIVSMIEGAKRIWLARERERGAEARERADADFAETLEMVEKLAADGAARAWTPPEGAKNVAELVERRALAKPAELRKRGF